MHFLMTIKKAFNFFISNMLIIFFPLLHFLPDLAAAYSSNFIMFLSLKANTQIKIKEKNQKSTQNNSKIRSPFYFDQVLLSTRLAMEYD